MKILHIVLILMLSACSTLPFHPAVVVGDSKPFVGMTELLAHAPEKALDVILVHGMCTHDQQWAVDTINRLASAAGRTAGDKSIQLRTGQEQGITIVSATAEVPAGTLRFSAFVWSGLTAERKASLAYDVTGTPTDCAIDQVCRPVRAKLNGMLKDKLMNDCLADALIYQGGRQAAINQAFIAAISAVAGEQESRGAGQKVPLVLVSESLGSKMTLDALNLMLDSAPGSDAKRAGEALGGRLAYLYMGANQLPLLSLADHAVTPRLVDGDQRSGDALRRFLEHRVRQRLISQTTVVAFTDPNDQLSYRLVPAAYGERVAIANVLVSNDKTYLGFVENPYTAHVAYLDNADVTRAIVCGIPSSGACK